MTAVEKRERAKQERRDAIIAAAVRVFLDRGVQSATMDEIAREAQLSKGALYLYFSSKDELFLSIALEWLGELQTQMDRLSGQSHETGLALLRAAAKTYSSHAISERGRFQVAMSWLNSDYSVDGSSVIFSEYRAQIAQKFQFITGAIERAKADGSLSVDMPTPRFAMQLWGAVLGLILVEQNSEEMGRRLPLKPPTDGICHAFIDNFLDAMSGSGTPHLQVVSSEEDLS
jgi:AcrR family transcriptional regulator